MSDANAGKRAAARAAVELVQSGMKLGLGSGSTFLFALERLGERVRQEQLDVVGVPTSRATEAAAKRAGVPVASLDDFDVLDLAIDGADEVDPRKNLVKGGGGALLREKIVASAAREMVVVVDASKLVDVLCRKFLLPVEVLPFGCRQTERRVAATGCQPALRKLADGQPYVTDNGNYILDCRYEGIEDPAFLHDVLSAVPGVVECGLFVGLAGRVFVGDADGNVQTIS